MSRSLDPMMKDLRELALRMGSRAEAILDKSLRALHDRNPALADEVAGDDLEIDRLDVAIDQAVLRALALQSPVAEDLREVIAVKMVANDLERVGDLARNIAKGAVRLSGHADQPAPDGLEELAQRTQRVLRLALDAFTNIDADLAREVLAEDDRIDELEEEVVRATLRAISSHPDVASEAVDFILVAKNLERAADHATNIAEDAILVAEARNVKHAAKLRAGS